MKAFAVAVPTWGLGVGGTRFAKFPIPGEPIDIHEKLEDAAVVQPARPHDAHRLAALSVGQGRRPGGAARRGRRARARLRRGELQHLPGPAGPAAGATSSARSPTPTRRCATRPSPTTSTASTSASALGSKAITVWIGDGANFPGQQNQTAAFDRYLDSMSQIYAALPADWRMFIEHKLYEPAFYSTVISRLGHQPDRRPAARRQGAVPGRPRPPCAERQHRADRRPPGALRKARRLPLQRLASTATTTSTPARSTRTSCS